MESVKFRIYVVRHGETDWNRTQRLQGQSDVSLNETGLEQSMLVGEALKDVSFVRAFSSDLQRALKTAECILQYQSDCVLEKEESIRERYYQDKSQGEMPGTDKSAPSTETMPEFSARCLAWYTRSIENYMISTVKEGVPMDLQPHNILVVSHGGCVLTLLTALQAKGAVTCREGVEIGYCLNTGVSVVEYTDIPSGEERPLVGTLVQYSGVEHLARKNLTPLEINADILGDAWWQP